MNGNDVYKVKEFSLANLTANNSYYADETFEQWQRNNTRVKVVGIVPFQKTAYSTPSTQNGNTINGCVLIPIPQPMVENWFLVQYLELDPEKQASQLETFLAKDDEN